MADLTDFDERNTLIVDERYFKMVPENATGADSSASIRLLSYSPNKLTYASNSTSGGVAVFSEIYYDDKKGWNAYLDGKPAETFPGRLCTAGHGIACRGPSDRIKFEPKSIVQGNKIAMAGSVLLFLFVFGTFGFSGYKKFKQIEAEPKVEPKAKASYGEPHKANKKK